MIGGIWNNDYVCELGVLEHLNECLALHKRWQELKAESKAHDKDQEKCKKVRRQIMCELADLFLILEKFLPGDIIDDRERLFMQKEKEDCNGQ